MEITIRRLPNARVYAIQRSAEGENLGIKRIGGTADVSTCTIKSVLQATNQERPPDSKYHYFDLASRCQKYYFNFRILQRSYLVIPMGFFIDILDCNSRDIEYCCLHLYLPPPPLHIGRHVAFVLFKIHSICLPDNFRHITHNLLTLQAHIYAGQQMNSRDFGVSRSMVSVDQSIHCIY